MCVDHSVFAYRADGAPCEQGTKPSIFRWKSLCGLWFPSEIVRSLESTTLLDERIYVWTLVDSATS